MVNGGNDQPKSVDHSAPELAGGNLDDDLLYVTPGGSKEEPAARRSFLTGRATGYQNSSPRSDRSMVGHDGEADRCVVRTNGHDLHLIPNDSGGIANQPTANQG